ncbi:MAG: acyltransferase [Polyangiaceae bacterium]|nr:acyltransferase [Polyangiaceae bacterium]MCW5791033.1 acyltransferase [Polyangiaceae bacterium]
MARALPETRCFELKRQLLRGCQVRVGAGTKIASSVRFMTGGPVEIGAATWIAPDGLFQGGTALISIGEQCDIAGRVTFATGSHERMGEGVRIAGPGYSTPIIVEDGCWIGTGAILLGGAHIGKSSIIAAGAVVRGVFPPESLIGGVPARLIGSSRPEP